MKKKLVAIVDDWERLERYEEHLSPFFEVHCAPFGRFGVQLALELNPEFILVDVVFEDLQPDEVRELIRRETKLDPTRLILISDSSLNSHGNSLENSLNVSTAKDFILQRPLTWQALLTQLRRLCD